MYGRGTFFRPRVERGQTNGGQIVGLLGCSDQKLLLLHARSAGKAENIESMAEENHCTEIYRVNQTLPNESYMMELTSFVSLGSLE